MKKKIFTAVYLLTALLCSAKDYKGAEIRTKESFLYGRFEVRMKSCAASGMLISFFTFYDDVSFATNWNEIDIEILGRYSNEVQFNAIVGNHEMHEKRHVLNFNPHQDFHTYSFDWTPEYIAWKVDGEEVYKLTGPHAQRMNKNQKIMMNIWPSQFWEWTGPWDEQKLPLSGMYDYVKYYEYTPGKEEKFSLKWEDHFDKIDYSRWEFATHTFDGNNCDFDPSNAKVKNGALLLSLTRYKGEAPLNTREEEKPAFPTVIKAKLLSNGKVKVTFSSPVTKGDTKIENFHIDGISIVRAFLWMDMQNLELKLSAPLTTDKEHKLKFVPSGRSDDLGTQEIIIEK